MRLATSTNKERLREQLIAFSDCECYLTGTSPERIKFVQYLNSAHRISAFPNRTDTILICALHFQYIARLYSAAAGPRSSSQYHCDTKHISALPCTYFTKQYQTMLHRHGAMLCLHLARLDIATTSLCYSPLHISFAIHCQASLYFHNTWHHLDTAPPDISDQNCCMDYSTRHYCHVSMTSPYLAIPLLYTALLIRTLLSPCLASYSNAMTLLHAAHQCSGSADLLPSERSVSTIPPLAKTF